MIQKRRCATYVGRSQTFSSVMTDPVMFSSQQSEWETPQELFEHLHKKYKFTVDAAASIFNAKLPRFWSKENNGLAQNWEGERVWLNPPYGRGSQSCAPWVKKAALTKNCFVMMLLPARTDTGWWHDYVQPYAKNVEFIRGRLRFEGGLYPAPFPSVLVIFNSTGHSSDQTDG